MLTCREFTDFLMEFLDDELPLARRRLFLKHIAACRDCARYVESYSTTVALARGAWFEPNEAVGAESVPEGLIRSILAACRASSAHLWHLIGAVAASPILFFYFGSQ